MTLIIEAALSAGSGVDPVYLRLDDPVAGRLDIQQLAPDTLMTDLSFDANGFSRVMAFSIDRGSTQGAGALVEYAAGTLSLTLRDDDGDLDPVTIDEPIPGSLIRLSKIWNGDPYPLFTGTIDSWLPEHRYPDQAVIVITASDMLASVGGYTPGESASVGAGDDAGARLGRILDKIAWPAGQRDIDTGFTDLVASTLGGNALDQARNVAKAEVGDLYATTDGLIRFRNRTAPYTDTRSTTVQATFGSGGGTEIPWIGTLGLSYDRTGLVNVIRAMRDDDLAPVYEIGDSASRDRYGDKAPEDTVRLPFATDSEVQDWESYVLARDSMPKFRFDSLDLDVRADEDLLYPQVLGRDLGDRIAVVRRPPGVAPDTREVHIRGIHHEFQAPLAWRTSWALEPAPSANVFILDDATRGRLDLNSLIY
jgi:hypothetical protein